MSMLTTGGCQCGNIRYEVTGEPQQIVVCHCLDCQRQSGSAFGMTMVVAADSFRIVKGTPREYHSISATGRSKLGAFCPDCGTRIYHQPEWRKGTISVKPGTLDNTSALRPQLHIWVKNKQPWVEIPPNVERHDGQPS